MTVYDPVGEPRGPVGASPVMGLFTSWVMGLLPDMLGRGLSSSEEDSLLCESLRAWERFCQAALWEGLPAAVRGGLRLLRPLRRVRVGRCVWRPGCCWEGATCVSQRKSDGLGVPGVLDIV